MRRSIEVDYLDRVIRFRHSEVLFKKMDLDTAQRLARRDVMSRTELERAVTDVSYEEAREAEQIANRALIAYYRDTRGWAIPRDEAKE